MSTGHRSGEERTPAELKKILAQGDTQKLVDEHFTLDNRYDIPDLGGCSVDRETVYIDRTFAAAVRAGKVKVPHLSAQDILNAIATHEHVEACIVDGDNPIDLYHEAHEYATTAEHEHVCSLGADPERYEAALKEWIERAEHEDPTNPPRDLWCAPYLDEPDADDQRQLKMFRAKNVVDAFKVSKASVKYDKAKGEDCCGECEHWMRNTKQDAGHNAMCEGVSGLVRDTRWCTRFEEMD
jgi:hypothetical protein